MFLQLSSKKNKIYLWKLRPGQKAEANTTPVMEDAWCKGAMIYKKLKSMPDKTTTDLHVFSIHKIPCVYRAQHYLYIYYLGVPVCLKFISKTHNRHTLDNPYQVLQTWKFKTDNVLLHSFTCPHINAQSKLIDVVRARRQKMAP